VDNDKIPIPSNTDDGDGFDADWVASESSAGIITPPLLPTYMVALACCTTSQPTSSQPIPNKCSHACHLPSTPSLCKTGYLIYCLKNLPI
jgi:hypothetical protein